MPRLITALLFAAFVGTVYAANWSLERWGTVPVGFGLVAPAGVYFAGLAFGLRDGLNERRHGRLWVVAAILVGAALSYVISDAVTIPGGHAPIAVASAAAFLTSELLDFAVYDRLRDRNWPTAVAGSNVVGAVADSVLFLWLAFGALGDLAGQLLGKAYMILPAMLLVWWARRDRPICWACDGATDETVHTCGAPA